MRKGMEYTLCETSWGWIALAASGEGLCRLELPRPGEEEARQNLLRWLPQAHPAAEEAFAPLPALLRRYLAGQRVEWDVPLDLSRGTAFQRAVWHFTHTIPYGERRSYGEVAAAVGRPRASRAVGLALGRNPVALIVPCHRVVRRSGELGGFGSGLEMKERLLRMEARGT